MPIWRGVIILMGTVLTCASGVQSEPAAAPLSMVEAVRRGLEASPTLRVGRAWVEQAEARVRGARTPLNPSVTAQHAVGNRTGGLDDDLVITQTVELGGKRRARTAVAEAGLRAARADNASQTLRTEFEIRQAYRGALVALGELELARQSLRLAEEFGKTASAQFTAGEAPRSQVVRSELEMEIERGNVTDAHAALTEQLTRLNSAIGAPAGTEWTLTDALPVAFAKVDLADLRARALTRPELEAARARLDASRAAERVAARTGKPDLFVGGTLGRFDTGGVSARAGVTFPLLDRGSLRAGRDAARAATRESDATLAEVQRSVSLAVELSYQRIVRAQRAAEDLESRQRPRAEELLKMAQEAYQAGLGNYLELLDAQRAFNTTSAAILRARAAYALALAEAELVSGVVLTGEKSP